MKKVLILIFVSISVAGYTQKTTQAIAVTGLVKESKTFSVADIEQLKVHDIGAVTITSHTGEKRSELTSLRGVLLKDLLNEVVISAENPKVLSAYYFVCKASDGYTVVFSWNELFNAATGDAAYLVTDKNGESMAQMDDAILLICPRDVRTGRRHIKSLATIEVKRAN
ncbi:MAG: molybdopterin-binding protein [Bacteroidota bacterium]